MAMWSELTERQLYWRERVLAAYVKAHGISVGTPPQKNSAAPQLSNRIIEFGDAAALRMKLRCATA
jgi:hypothetical protein